MKSIVNELKNARQEALEKAEAAFKAKDQATFRQHMDDVTRLGTEIEQARALEAEAGRFDENDPAMATLHDAIAGQKKAEALENRADRARSGNEYLQAFAYAIRNGVTIAGGRGIEQCKPLYAALTEGGGTPAGADGGFLIPVDFDNMIHEIQRALTPLSGFFRHETVGAPTGWRALDTAPTQGFAQVNEMAQIQPTSQPAFRKVSYSLVKYGGIIPVSQELIDDNTVGLMRYLARWFAKKATITENTLLLGLLSALTPAAVVVGDEVKAIKKALNVTLDPAIAGGAIILTNQSGLQALDVLEDNTGKPLMQPDVTDKTMHRLLGRRVVVMPDAVMPNLAGAAPVYLGDVAQYGTLFRKGAFEVASTNIGGNAWATDSVETRGLMRLDAKVFDDKAVTALKLTVA